MYYILIFSPSAYYQKRRAAKEIDSIKQRRLGEIDNQSKDQIYNFIKNTYRDIVNHSEFENFYYDHYSNCLDDLLGLDKLDDIIRKDYTEIKKEDKIEYPERIIATYWKNEPADEWGSDSRKVKVNGRKWVKIV